MKFSVDFYKEGNKFMAYIANEDGSDSGYKISADTEEDRAEQIKNYFLNVEKENFYDKEFTGGLTTITRADLENLPIPFCTENVSDETMQSIIDNVDAEMKQRFGRRFSFSKDECSEYWWAALEDECVQHEIPYYEDLED